MRFAPRPGGLPIQKIVKVTGGKIPFPCPVGGIDAVLLEIRLHLIALFLRDGRSVNACLSHRFSLSCALSRFRVGVWLEVVGCSGLLEYFYPYTGIKVNPYTDIFSKIYTYKEFNVTLDWLLTGEGPMYREKQREETADASAVLAAQIPQHAENTNDKKQKTADASAVLDIQRELTEALKQGMEFQKQAMALTQENADIRIAFERAQLENERHLSRIHDLEREAAEIPALKARIVELERELSERPKLPKTVPVDVSAKSKPTPAHGAGTDTAVVPGTSAGVSGVGALGAVVRRNGE